MVYCLFREKRFVSGAHFEEAKFTVLAGSAQSSKRSPAKKARDDGWFPRKLDTCHQSCIPADSRRWRSAVAREIRRISSPLIFAKLAALTAVNGLKRIFYEFLVFFRVFSQFPISGVYPQNRDLGVGTPKYRKLAKKSEKNQDFSKIPFQAVELINSPPMNRISAHLDKRAGLWVQNPIFRPGQYPPPPSHYSNHYCTLYCTVQYRHTHILSLSLSHTHT